MYPFVQLPHYDKTWETRKYMNFKTTQIANGKKGTLGIEPTCSELAWGSGHRTHRTGPVSGSVPTPEFLEFRDPANR